MYCAVIGDIQDSRSVPDRSRLQQAFHTTMDRVNTAFDGSVRSKFLVTLGDEFQGLLQPDASFLRVVRFIDQEMQEVSLRYGIGFGRLETPLRERAVGMDGPAFHRARTALEEASGRGGHRITVKGLDELFTADDRRELIKALLHLVDHVEQNWSARDWKVIRTYEACGLVSETAERLGLHRTSVSRRLKSAHYREVQAALSALYLAFDPHGGETT